MTPSPPPPALPEGAEKPPAGVHLMAVVRWLLVLAMALGALATWSAYLGREVAQGRAVAGHAHQKWTCPMHPQVVRDAPGSCPICGMTLVPVEAGAVGAGVAELPGLAPVTLSPERIQLAGMRTVKVERQQLAPVVRALGTVGVDERRLARVHVRVQGWITQVPATTWGQHVVRGEVLARIESPELVGAERELLALVRSHAADDFLQDARRRLELVGVSPQDAAEVVRTGQPQRDLAIRAPVTGHVVRQDAVEGLTFSAGAELFEIADLSEVWVQAAVPEGELSRVRVGQRARLELAAWPGRAFAGTVDFLAPSVDPQSRTLAVRLRLANPHLDLRPGMTGDVRIATQGASALVVPREAVVDTGEAQYAFVALEGGRFEPRRLRLGQRADDLIEVLEGVAEGEQVVTTANFLLDSESRLRSATSAQRRE